MPTETAEVKWQARSLLKKAAGTGVFAGFAFDDRE